MSVDIYTPSVSYGEKTSTGFRLATVHMGNRKHIISEWTIDEDVPRDCSDWYVKYSDYQELLNKYNQILENGYE
jgi:hypothetical protein